jgi:pyruvate formate lyase activating enzyme
MSCSEPEGRGGDPQQTGVVFNIQRFSIEDGPGIRTTVFMKGCPMRCVWCHNPEGIAFERQLMWFDVRCIGARDCLEACPNGALELGRSGMTIDRERCDACGRCADACPARALELVGKDYTPHEAFQEVYRDEAFYRNSGGGVTVSGGEPSMQPRFVAELLRLSKEAGLHTALDTCGFASGTVLEKLLESADMVLLDLKHMDPAKHLELTGVELEPVLENARMVSSSGRPVWVRTPVVPGCTDSAENIASIGRFIAEELPSVERWDLLAFNNTCGSKYSRLDMTWELEGVPLLSAEAMEALAEKARAAGVPEVCWSGTTRSS